MRQTLHPMSFRILPGTCVVCGEASGRSADLCPGCEQDLPWHANGCDYCALPLARADTICGPCIVRRPAYSAVLPAFSYRFPVDVMISRFKEAGQLAFGTVLSSLLLQRHGETICRLAQPDTLLVPVPLHWLKLRRRGFNQSRIIADVISAGTGISVDASLLKRLHNGNELKRQGNAGRKLAISGAFSASSAVRGRRVMLIDDVVTTQATVNECTKVLMQAGASDVVILALARTPLDPAGG